MTAPALPFRRYEHRSEEQNITPPRPESTSTKRRADPYVVAVVDDDEAVRGSMERVLRSAGYRVVLYSDGADLIVSLRSASPACVLLDLEMPWATGLDVLSHLARQRVRIPAIIVTGRDTQYTRRRAAIGGAAAYFTKPIDPSVLLTAIEAVIKNTGGSGMDAEGGADSHPPDFS